MVAVLTPQEDLFRTLRLRFATCSTPEREEPRFGRVLVVTDRSSTMTPSSELEIITVRASRPGLLAPGCDRTD